MRWRRSTSGLRQSLMTLTWLSGSYAPRRAGLGGCSNHQAWAKNSPRRRCAMGGWSNRGSPRCIRKETPNRASLCLHREEPRGAPRYRHAEALIVAAIAKEFDMKPSQTTAVGVSPPQPAGSSAVNFRQGGQRVRANRSRHSDADLRLNSRITANLTLVTEPPDEQCTPNDLPLNNGVEFPSQAARAV